MWYKSATTWFCNLTCIHITDESILLGCLFLMKTCISSMIIDDPPNVSQLLSCIHVDIIRNLKHQKWQLRNTPILGRSLSDWVAHTARNKCCARWSMKAFPSNVILFLETISAPNSQSVKWTSGIICPNSKSNYFTSNHHFLLQICCLSQNNTFESCPSCNMLLKDSWFWWSIQFNEVTFPIDAWVRGV